MREEVEGGIQGTWAEDAGGWPKQHFLAWKKIIQILGRIAQCKCSYKPYNLNNVGGNGRWTIPVSSKVRDNGGFLSHSTFGLVLIFKFANTCLFCYSEAEEWKPWNSESSGKERFRISERDDSWKGTRNYNLITSKYVLLLACDPGWKSDIQKIWVKKGKKENYCIVNPIKFPLLLQRNRRMPVHTTTSSISLSMILTWDSVY